MRKSVKRQRIILSAAAALLFVGCFKDVSYRTTYVVKPLQQQTQDDRNPPVIPGATAFAYDVDTTAWCVASYDDAVAGIVTSKDNPAQRLATPVATSQPYVLEGTEGWLQMPLEQETQMVVVVDPVNRLYAYTQQTLAQNLPTTYVSVVFQPWKSGFSYKYGNWSIYNDFYEPPVWVDCYIDARTQDWEGADELPLADDSELKAYAYAVDTTDWYIVDYDAALAGRIASKTSTQTRTKPDFMAYAQNDSDLYGMEVSASTLMVVVVDRVHRLYAYSRQDVDLDPDTSVTFSVLFRPWLKTWIDVAGPWRIVDESLAPDDTDDTGDPENPQTTLRR